MDFSSPLRYPGGKGKLVNFVENIFQNNLLSGGHYFEPYAGGASIAISLLFNEYASKITINDIDRSIYAFWFSVLNETEQLCKKIWDTKVSLTTWRNQKLIQKKKENHDLLTLGFSTFFLNRTNRSGILNAGVIGGLKQSGDYKINARYNKSGLISRIERIAKYKNRISLYNEDGCRLVSKLLATLPKKTLIYLDPPYYIKGKDLYYNFFQHADHVRVYELVKSINNCSWIVSYDNATQIKKIFWGIKRTEYNLDYCALKPKEGKEIMFYDNRLIIPKVQLKIKNV